MTHLNLKPAYLECGHCGTVAIGQSLGELCVVCGEATLRASAGLPVLASHRPLPVPTSPPPPSATKTELSPEKTWFYFFAFILVLPAIVMLIASMFKDRTRP
jgi:hypothetical protein